MDTIKTFTTYHGTTRLVSHFTSKAFVGISVLCYIPMAILFLVYYVHSQKNNAGIKLIGGETEVV